MIDKDKLVQEFTGNLSKFYATTNVMRNEIFRSYEYKDGTQWDTVEDNNRLTTSGNTKNRKERILRTVNLAAPIVRAVVGSEVMEPSTLDYISTDPQFDVEADIISDACEWAQYVSNYQSERSIAAEDAATCGIGATVTYLDTTNRDFIAGVPIVERVFPNFLAFDRSSRGSQVNLKSSWVAYADPVSTDWMDGYIEEMTGGKTQAATDSAGDYKTFLLSRARLEHYDDIEFIHHYFWYDFEKIYDVANPFMDQQNVLSQVVMQDEDVANSVGEVTEDLQIDWQASFWSVDKDDYKKLAELVEMVQLLIPDAGIEDLEFSTRKGKIYYRAEFARGMLLKSGRSYSQSGHALNFITGYFEESTCNFYGMMRPLSEVQDNINELVTDFMAYSRAASHGGSAWVKGAGEAFERIQKDRINEDDITPIPGSTEIIPKALISTPQILLQGITLMTELLPRTLGLGQEFLGVVTSGDMTDSLFGRVMKQSYAVLEAWKNNSANYDIRQGRIFEELIRLMAEADEGKILPVLSADNDPQAFTRLSLQSLARNYAIRIIERPLTADERQETFNELSQLAPQALQAGVNLFPMLAKYAPVDYSDRQEMIEMATPPPPQPPDPLSVATMQSNIDFTNASAAKAQADAAKTNADVEAMTRDVDVDRITKEAELEGKIAKAELDEAKTKETMATIVGKVKDSESRIMERLNSMQQSQQAPASTYIDNSGVLEKVVSKITEDSDAKMQVILDTLTAEREAVRDDEGRMVGTRVKR